MMVEQARVPQYVLYLLQRRRRERRGHELITGCVCVWLGHFLWQVGGAEPDTVVPRRAGAQAKTAHAAVSADGRAPCHA